MAHKIYGQNVTIISGGGGSQPQLNAPTISITGNTLTITNPTSNGDFVTAYKVYTEYGYVATVTETTVDLTTIITEDGTYNVFVTCEGTNFEDSIASNAVSWTKGESEDPLAGTWVFNDTLYGWGSSTTTYNVNFISNNINYSSIVLGVSRFGDQEFYYDSTLIGTPSAPTGYVGDAYKTITITSKLSEVTNGDSLLAWLQENATKQ